MRYFQNNSPSLLISDIIFFEVPRCWWSESKSKVSQNSFYGSNKVTELGNRQSFYCLLNYNFFKKIKSWPKTYHLFPFVLFCRRLLFFCHFGLFRNGHQHATKNTNISIFTFGFQLGDESLTKKLPVKINLLHANICNLTECACSTSQIELYINSVLWARFGYEILVFHTVQQF